MSDEHLIHVGRFRITYPSMKTTDPKATDTACPIFCQIVDVARANETP